MTLIDKIARSDNIPHDQRVPGHIFEYTVWLWLRGHLTNNEADIFGFTGQEKSKMMEFKNKFDSLPNLTEQIAYSKDVVAAVLLLQNNKIDKTKFKQIVGLS